jgi:hypothetical protein
LISQFSNISPHFISKFHVESETDINLAFFVLMNWNEFSRHAFGNGCIESQCLAKGVMLQVQGVSRESCGIINAVRGDLVLL